MCGLAGIISTEKTEFNANHFNVLGTLNDERGGDSCGIFINGKVNYGIGKTEMFRNFTTEISYPKSASIALLHCRKASVGYPVNLTQAQPIIIKRNNKIEFVLMHNGTISNIKTLATKYIPNFNTIGLSDSQILAQIIYTSGYNVLEEYAGCAVLIMVDYRQETPEVLIFKGSSCYNELKASCERPLYYMINEGKFYFSSMFSSLYCINNKKTIYNFPSNQLCKIKNNNVYLVKNIDRTKLTRSVFSYYSKSNYYDDDDYDYNHYNDNIKYDESVDFYRLQNGKPAHGKYCVYSSGYMVPEKYQNSTFTNTFYFFNGRILPNKECFDFLTGIADLFEPDTFNLYCPEVIDYFACNPRNIDGELKMVNENFCYIPYKEGNFVTLFGDSNKVTVVNNNITRSYLYATTAIEKFKEHTKGIYYNFDELENQIMTFINNRLNC